MPSEVFINSLHETIESHLALFPSLSATMRRHAKVNICIPAAKLARRTMIIICMGNNQSVNLNNQIAVDWPPHFQLGYPFICQHCSPRLSLRPIQQLVWAVLQSKLQLLVRKVGAFNF